jgi:restriction system protein
MSWRLARVDMSQFYCKRCDQPLAADELSCPRCASAERVAKLEAHATMMAFSSVQLSIDSAAQKSSLALSSLIIPEGKTAEGSLIKSVSATWYEIVRYVGSDWSNAHKIPADKWEEIVAGAFKKANFDEVTLTPRSGDHGRDVIAIRRGFGCVKIIGSVKAYAPGNLVPYDDVRALLGVMSGEQDASKGIITTTSDFPPRIADDPFIKPFLPTRLELVNGTALRQWLADVSRTS